MHRGTGAAAVTVGRLAVVGVLAVATLVSLSGPAQADTATTRCASSDPFTATLAQQLATTYPGQQFSGSVYDERTGCQYDLHPTERIGTASVLKVEIMAGILLRAQNEGRGLTAAEAGEILPMITQSDNTAATTLWESLGEGPGMANLDSVFGLNSTVPASPLWGLTSTSAADQVHLLRQVLLGDFGPLSAPYRNLAINYMTSVTPSQRWGITAGVPAGWTVANKNGWAPGSDGLWNVNSTGVVWDPSGGGYAIALLSTGWSGEAPGITGIETVSRAVAAQLARPRSDPDFIMTDQIAPPVADHAAVFGDPGDVPLVGDWTGDGIDTPGVQRGNTFYLRNSIFSGVADESFTFGDPGDIPIVGDWNGDGIDTIGVMRGDTFYLRNTNTTGIADETFQYGDPGDIPIAGDWNGDHIDTVGVMRGDTFYLRNTNTTGIADETFQYGDLGDVPIVGDWTGRGIDTVGIQRGNAFYLRDSNTTGVADQSFLFGNVGDVPLAGDWNGDHVDSVGIAEIYG